MTDNPIATHIPRKQGAAYRQIRAATMCSGIGAPETAMPEWEWAWCAEIEPFPSRVLAARHPRSVNLGDMTADDFSERAAARGPIDVLVAGTPCQSFSIAGLRRGLSDDRGNITLRALQIYEDLCNAARSAGRPEPVYLWENVPGVFSHKDNPFGCLLAGLAGSETPFVPPPRCGWTVAGVVAGPARTVAWRVLDAQYFGVPQRRERVFVVASARTGGIDPVSVLFERKEVRVGFGARGEARKDVAPTLGRGSPGGRVYGLDADTVESLQPVYAIQERAVSENPNAGPDGKGWQEGTAFTLEARSQVQAVAYGGGNCSGPIDVAACLTAKGQRQDFEIETFIAHAPIPFDTTQITSPQNRSHPKAGDPCHPLAAGMHPPAIAFDCKASGQNGGGHLAVAVAIRGRENGAQIEISDDQAFTVRASQGGSDKPHVLTHAVRRLMPVECERLQGFPDHHTDVPNGNKPAADGPRYKSLGNTMANPVIRWISRRIETQIHSRSGNEVYA